MKNSSCRYLINALGKRGETYHTHCRDKEELKKWIAENQDKLSMKDLKVIDKNRHPLLQWFSFSLRNINL
ncbi:hypothetical protein [Mesobacillus zeae]|uniref:Uncharacterized protein n=1 Tax=Mesobacillus zeae TaxID=1917180 RepID=A0A398AX66_9BACI|nr:hypothetical protein [Mesobacillus zeae]RID82259.1 hypothetical protein D1970_19710 [Mesobacillus zeae]